MIPEQLLLCQKLLWPAGLGIMSMKDMYTDVQPVLAGYGYRIGLGRGTLGEYFAAVIPIAEDDMRNDYTGCSNYSQNLAVMEALWQFCEGELK